MNLANTCHLFRRATFLKCLKLVSHLSVIGCAFSASAAPPIRSEFSYSTSTLLEGICPFPIQVNLTVVGTQTLFLDKSGNLVRLSVHQSEQDVFSANGKRLVGLPFTFNLEVYFDKNGQITHLYSNGLAEKIRLPDGTLFVSAGRVDFTAHPGAVFTLAPDHGHTGNLAAFCAALSP